MKTYKQLLQELHGSLNTFRILTVALGSGPTGSDDIVDQMVNLGMTESSDWHLENSIDSLIAEVEAIPGIGITRKV